MAIEHSSPPSARHIISLVVEILKGERSFLALAVIYGIGISLLSLATPIAVQVLINSVGYTGLTIPLIVLSGTLFGLLLASGLLNALRVHLMEIFARRFYARMTSEIALRALYAQNPFFQDEGRGALFNRYFDIMLVQKAVPVLMIGGFTVILQAGVGFVLTSFYHPLFLAFNVVVIALIWLIWLVWGASAVRSAVQLSHSKHQAASWLQGLASSNGYFKSDQHVAYALQRTDSMTGDYVEKHCRHFRRHFAQTVSFLVLYALASAALLGLGGWLVIQGQLTLGQLVAAELVLSVAFFGVSQLGSYLTYFYDLCAACEELSLFWTIDQEEPAGVEQPSHSDASLVFDGVRGEARGREACFNLEIASGTKLQAAASTHGTQRLFTNLLKRFVEPKGGVLTLGGDDIRAMEVHALRREVVVLDRPNLVEMPMREYLRLANPDASSAEMLQVLRDVGLLDSIEDLDNGLDTELSATGWPLSTAEAMRLKLAAAILSRPSVLVLNQLFDTMPKDVLCRALANVRTDGGTPSTVIVFTSRGEDLGIGSYLYLEPERQRVFEDHRSFYDAISSRPRPVPLEPVSREV
ncbi:ABC transporter transmembrane domain-containing protein [Parvularcula lutaonensis]|uniref:ABC transporter transmembrane domain-containing protein n=1 Tax=Parvularcula lutaonensis TaxID=491923 RepID=A0ABV7M8X6_9PROT|nr:ABC transporter ATP-binding protein [Parvularcula lutaonensis]GGY57015.1 ABC transporter ATP-binding protein [Parvularcula lutaonensis]